MAAVRARTRWAIPGYLYGRKHLVRRKGDDSDLEKSITSALHSAAPTAPGSRLLTTGCG